MIYIGIDPGKSGAMAILDENGVVAVHKWTTPHDMANALRDDLLVDRTVNKWPACFAVLERLQPMPHAQRGVVASFKLGANYGTWIGILAALGIPHQLTPPGVWQRKLGCLSKGDKNVTKARAQQLFPSMKVTHATADALLIAEFCRRLKADK